MIRVGEIVELGQSRTLFVFLGKVEVTGNWMFYVYSKDMLKKPLNPSLLRNREGIMLVRETRKRLNEKEFDLWYLKNKMLLNLPAISSYELDDANIICNKPKIGYIYCCFGPYLPYALYLGHKRFLLLCTVPLNEEDIDSEKYFNTLLSLNVLRKLATERKYDIRKMPRLQAYLEEKEKNES